MNKVKQMQLVGIHFVRVPYRYYPEEMLASQVIGFVGKDENGNDIGRYGAEGYWNNELAGSGGFFEGTKSAKGSWITLAGSLMKPAVDGADMVLTIDRTLQFKACEKLLEAQTKYGAQSSALIIMEPQTGAIRAMCSFPTFDPNEYNKVQDAQAFNNSAIFTPYEPGSIFKPIAMSGVLNEKIANPETPFFDSGSSDAGCTKVIKNADLKAYGAQTMTGILQHSINTGMVYVANLLGKQKFLEYINNYGFGTKTGLELDVEASGTVQNLYQNKGNKIDCYTATAAFGQGITVTPLQMVNAYSAIANGGILMKPYIVGEVRYSDGRIEKTKPKEIRRVIEKKYASLLSAMLVRVVDFEATLAHIPGYFMAGKTGTAQIPGPGGYTDDKNHSYVGFGPVDDPKFVMIIKFEKPTKEVYSSMTAAPTFKDIAQFILQYYQIPPSK
jgi:cell division protein FtsI/penicillin-binding protein 2